ncbi:MAG: DUF362 domain-containing protein [Chloroflexota bacterium]
MAKSVVSITKGTNAEKMVQEALDLLGGVTSLIKPNSTVVIKPNAGHPYGPETSVNTSAAVLKAVIKEVRKANPKEIIVAEAAAVGCDTMECFEISGLGKAAKEAGADKIIDIKRETDLIMVPIRDARSDMVKVALPRFLVEAEHIIDVPIFKSHVSMVFTCALKNLKGVVQDKIHRQMHLTNLAEAMMDLWSVVRADLCIADMIRPAEGFGPHSTLPVDFGCIVAGKDPVAVDATVCRMVGLDVKKVPYFKPANECGLGNFQENRIEILGKTIDQVFKQLWLPYLGGFEAWPEYKIHAKNACSSCQGLLAFTMERLKAMGEYDKHAGLDIYVGAKKDLPPGVDPSQVILFGDCVKRHRGKGIFVDGCPPGESSPLWSILNRQDSEHRVRVPRTAAQEAAYTQQFIDHMKKMSARVKAENKGRKK